MVFLFKHHILVNLWFSSLICFRQSIYLIYSPLLRPLLYFWILLTRAPFHFTLFHFICVALLYHFLGLPYRFYTLLTFLLKWIKNYQSKMNLFITLIMKQKIIWFKKWFVTDLSISAFRVLFMVIKQTKFKNNKGWVIMTLNWWFQQNFYIICTNMHRVLLHLFVDRTNIMAVTCS